MEGKCGGEKRFTDAEIMPFSPARWTIWSQAARFDDIERAVVWLCGVDEHNVSWLSRQQQMTGVKLNFTFSNMKQICIWGNRVKALLPRYKMMQPPQWEGLLLIEFPPEESRNPAIKCWSWEGSRECLLRLGALILITLIKVLTVQSATACVNPKCKPMQTQTS